ncbi:MAG: hypothetical protein IPK19_21925 [Chloroflexi bacterium]|nr:hypothetical protein [Chloroflexota bacterium]
MIDLTPEEFRRLGYLAIDLIAERMPVGQSDQPVRHRFRQNCATCSACAGKTTTDPETLIRRVATEESCRIRWAMPTRAFWPG